MAVYRETAHHCSGRFQGVTDIKKRHDVDNFRMQRQVEPPIRRLSGLRATVVSVAPVFLEEIEALAHPLGIEVASSAQSRFMAIDDAIVHDPDLVVIDAGVAETVDLTDLIATLTGSLALRCVVVESPAGAPLSVDLHADPLIQIVHRPLSAAALSSVLTRP